MTDLKWTDEPPEEPGHFWLDDGQGAGLSPRVVTVRWSTVDDELVVDDPLDDTGIMRPLDQYSALWAGPIPEPQEPDD